ncbi:peptide MFS transporter [Leucobacter chromiiresistens]|uniref:peptide MFS transporter n=1 Tax=Leucobacter chromiiresistens TaxID=1079994 RepID=UPI000733F209|nr:oligopeptide:H+ symporter [Leucobacter chromiiresistens]
MTRALGVVADEAKPSGLITLSAAEMWERFSFYGLQVLLAYYLYYSVTDGGLGLPQPVALGIAGAYGGLVYIAQIVGAWIADRVLAPRYVVLIGGSAILAGHIMLAVVPGLLGLVIGLALIVIGTGGLKVNTTMMVGALYPKGGAKRDAGYSIYYMGITIGAFFGPLLTGWLHQEWGFHIAFGAAAAGMAVGLTQYAIGMRKLPASTAVVPNPLPPAHRPRWAIAAAAGIALVALVVATGMVRADNISNAVALVVVAAAVAIFAMLLTNRQVTPAERRSVVRYVPVFLMSLVFWTLLFQLFTAFAVFADTKIQLTAGSVTIPPTLIVTLESLAVAGITALLAVLWTRSRAARMQPVSKLVTGVVGARRRTHRALQPRRRSVDAAARRDPSHAAVRIRRSAVRAVRPVIHRRARTARRQRADDGPLLPHHGGRIDPLGLGVGPLPAGIRGSVLQHRRRGLTRDHRPARRRLPAPRLAAAGPLRGRRGPAGAAPAPAGVRRYCGSSPRSSRPIA